MTLISVFVHIVPHTQIPSLGPTNTCVYSRCHTRGESGEFIACRYQSVQMRETTLDLKPKADITRSQKQGYQWLTKRTYVLQNFLKKYVGCCCVLNYFWQFSMKLPCILYVLPAQHNTTPISTIYSGSQ